jgi:hypothetical protein
MLWFNIRCNKQARRALWDKSWLSIYIVRNLINLTLIGLLCDVLQGAFSNSKSCLLIWTKCCKIWIMCWMAYGGHVCLCTYSTNSRCTLLIFSFVHTSKTLISELYRITAKMNVQCLEILICMIWMAMWDRRLFYIDYQLSSSLQGCVRVEGRCTKRVVKLLHPDRCKLDIDDNLIVSAAFWLLSTSMLIWHGSTFSEIMCTVCPTKNVHLLIPILCTGTGCASMCLGN